jgi:hypothetical protein
MATQSFGDDFRDECAKKAIMWVPAIAGDLAFGPVGIAAGIVASVVMVASGGGGTSSPPDGNQEGK